jgi:WD40 repeat protein
VKSVAVSPDGERIVTGADDHIARVWHVRTSKVTQLKGHTAPVSAVAVAPDGVRIVTGSDDHTVRLWHATTLAQVGQSYRRFLVTA